MLKITRNVKKGWKLIVKLNPLITNHNSLKTFYPDLG